ncbi:MAG: lytic murein transglycosylase B [Gammaproteobacteria bacterium]
MPLKFLLFAILGSLSIAARAAEGDLLKRDDVRAFISTMVERHGFDARELDSVFDRVRISGSILEAIAKPAEALPWHRYRSIFVRPDRVRSGVEFWRRHAVALRRAEETYGVSQAVIVAIIGVETRYGRSQGQHKVIDSLVTLAFEYPKRADFFRGELEQFLLLTREQGVDPHAIRGSYAGAMGIPQFISSSYRHYAVDFDIDGLTDIWDNPTDAIGSVANYFREHGWLAGGLVTLPIGAPDGEVEGLIGEGLEPITPMEIFEQMGIETPIKVPGGEKAKLLELEGENGKEYWLGFWNFYVITRYNNSLLYAMAVFQLAEQIRTAHGDAIALIKGDRG